MIEALGTQLDKMPVDGAGFTKDSGRVVGYPEFIHFPRALSRWYILQSKRPTPS